MGDTYDVVIKFICLYYIFDDAGEKRGDGPFGSLSHSTNEKEA